MHTISELLDGYAQKKFSPVEIISQYLERAKKNSDLNAFITVTEEYALQQARISEQRWQMGEQGVLEGIPISYKDNIFTKGVRTTSGSFIDREFVPTKHAPIVDRLNQVGTVMIGKTNMHEFAFGITNNNPFYGSAKNPWNKAYISGGSSGGSAVSVAADLCVASIGTDTGGSIRIPSSCCGLVGLKPTQNLLDGSGTVPISWSLDHLGPIAKNVSDVMAIMEALTNQRYFDTTKRDLRGIRVGIPRKHFTERIEPEVLRLYEETIAKFEELGAILMEVEVPHIEEGMPLTMTLAIGEAGYVHRERIAAHLDEYGEDVRQVMETSQSITTVSYIEALQRKREVSKACDHLMEQVDVLLTPTLPATAKKIGQEEVTIDGQAEPIFNCYNRYTNYFNVTGHPALSLPAGLTKDKLPVGIQLVTAKRGEKKLLNIAKVFEETYLKEFYKQRTAICAGN